MFKVTRRKRRSNEMSDNATASAISSAVSTIVQLTFVVLKLTHVINWSWWLVFLPTLIPLGLIILIAIIVALVALSMKG
jgi:fatty acid desaturase